MEPNDIENINSQNDGQENLDSSNENLEQSDDLQPKDGESQEEYTEREKQYYARIKKLEADLKEAKKPKAETKKVSNNDVELTPKDTLAFMATGVTEEEDIEEVLKLAKGFGMTVSEALKDDTVKHRLNVLKEQRKTAEAANTRPARSGAKQVDGKQLVDKLSKGEVPKPGSSDAEELFWARRGGRR
jgi:hypothetical protein